MLDRLEAYRKAVNCRLDVLVSDNQSSGSRLREAMRYSLLAGGKRLRPIFLLEFARMGGLPPEAALDAACAVEILHTYSLIHDDLPCMDDDAMRRGRPTCHVTYGEAEALLAGDALLNLTYETLLRSMPGIPPERQLRCAAAVAAAAGDTGMIAGQWRDIQNIRGNVTPDAEALRAITQHKTAALFVGACTAGLHLAGADDAERMDAARRFAEAFGLCFQIRDDMLDVEGNAETLGKAIGSDRTSGKYTFVDAWGMPACVREAERCKQEAADALRVFQDHAFLLELTDTMLQREQ